MNDSQDDDIIFEEVIIEQEQEQDHNNTTNENDKDDGDDQSYDDIEWDQVGGGEDNNNNGVNVNIEFGQDGETQELDSDNPFGENIGLSTTSTTTSTTSTNQSSLSPNISSNNMDLDDGLMDISIEIDTTKKKRASSNQVRYSKHQKLKIMNLHKSVLLCFILNFKHTLTTLEDDMIKSLVFSSIPQDIYQLVDSFQSQQQQQKENGSRKKKTNTTVNFNEMISDTIQWFRKQYKLDQQLDKLSKNDPNNNNNNNNNKKKEVIDVDNDICQLIGLTCRMVTFINPPLATPETPTKQKKLQSSLSPTLKRSTSAPEKIKKKQSPKKSSSPKKQQEEEEESDLSESDIESDYTPPLKVTSRQKAIQRSKSAPTISPKKKLIKKRKSITVDDSSSSDKSDKKKDEKKNNNNNPITVEVEESDLKIVGYWIEILDINQNKWISVDIINNRIDQPQLMEPQNCPFGYVVSFNNNQFKDITSKYTNNVVVSHIKRLPNAQLSWWTDLLEKQETKDNDKKNNTNMNIQDNADKFDQQLIRDKEIKSENFPTSFSAFKSHPLYILEKDIPKYSSLEPNAKSIGKFKDSFIYHRSSVKVLHVPDKWIQAGRMIMEGEQPVKVVKGKSGSSPTAMLFGEWQTMVYQQPIIKNGLVPTNSFGNVYLFKPEMIPIGGVHLKMGGLMRIARKLNISVGPALVGWENWGRRPHPKIEGVVVAKENAKTLTEAWIQDQQIRNEKEEKKQREEIIARWRRFTKGLLIGTYVENTYGSGAIDNTSTSKLFADDDENNPFKEETTSTK
ncbi:DNA repair protein Rad4 family protein [Cavenderia fasciculata]|uniref:DNA repair protein Rad4 family protein n=1 Tax=Cavenderia fasciculata TaxID=261658 RepID=F4PI32_CACFS|nr:DNA repair protein Rad4 family protein [Cavenderia fasciculata]EGG25315.1 DNA repair protein Rad4 family protein [Cavenderia fasciculata]|eukprot:XP_004363166.1 DNA repair protein Rad4 family protein [Cavenderia fasciculata]